MTLRASGDFIAYAAIFVEQVACFFVAELFGFLHIAGCDFVKMDAQSRGAADGYYGHAGLDRAV